MKYTGLISFLVVLIFTGCKVDVVSRAENSKVYASSSACGASKADGKEAAITGIVQKYPLIEEDLRQYITTHHVKGDGDFCYDARITRKKWMLYTMSMEDEKEEIASHATDKEYIGIFEYNDKDILTKTLLMERHRFNEKLKMAKMIAPMDLEPFPGDFKQLEKAINVLPSIKIKVQPCNNKKNYRCDVHFYTQAKDESNKLTYLWDFGEGSKSEKKNPTHRYDTEGRYSVSLQVTDAYGLSTFLVKDVLVTKSSERLQVREKSDLNAYFILKRKRYKVNDELFFDNRSKAVGSPVKAYSWDFGDGSFSTVRNPKHRYQKAGKYVVKYKVCNQQDNCAYASTQVNIVNVSKKSKPVVKKEAVKQPAKKTVQPVPVKKVTAAPAKTAVSDAHFYEPIEQYIARKGKPDETMIKSNATMSAYRYDKTWLLVKRDKIQCAVGVKGFATSMLGNPKSCRWHEKNAKKHIVQLQE